MPFRTLVPLLCLWCIGAAITVGFVVRPSSVRSQPDCLTLSQPNIDDCLRLNQIQVPGTRNSDLVAQPAPLAGLGERGRNLVRGSDLVFQHRDAEIQGSTRRSQPAQLTPPHASKDAEGRIGFPP
jgi:hypothetical protein